MSGLDQLKSQTAKRKGGGRSMPPPRHKPRQEQVEIPDEQAASPVTPVPASVKESTPTQPQTAAPTPTAKAETATVDTAPRQVPPAPAQKPRPASPAAASASATPRKVGPTTMYFDVETDDWLEDVLAIGRRGTPKVSSKSAIARLAIRELAKRMTIEQVVEELRRGAATSGNQTGRPRL